MQSYSWMLLLQGGWSHALCMPKGLACRERAAVEWVKNESLPQHHRATGTPKPRLGDSKNHSSVSAPHRPSGGSSAFRLARGFHYGETRFYQPVQNLATSGLGRGKSCENKDSGGGNLQHRLISVVTFQPSPFPSHTTLSCSTCKRPRTAWLSQRKQSV